MVNTSICAKGAQLPVLGNFLAARFHDGQPDDLLFIDSANQWLYIVSLRAASAGVQTAVSSIYLSSGAGPITTADLNNDGHLDILINSQSASNVAVLLGYGDGTIHVPGSALNGAIIAHSILIRDVNNDGLPDLIAEGANGRIDVYPGNGDGTFQPTSIGGTGTLDGITGNGGHLIALADLNHDGQLDALTSTPIGVSSLLGQGTQYLGLKGIFNAGPGMHRFATADFNGDGNLDVATDSPEGIAILYGNADGTFQTSQAFAAGAPALSAANGIFTQSGHTDAVVSTAATQAQLLRGQGDGTFLYNGAPAQPVPFGPAGSPAGLWSTVQAADFDGDGKLDVVLTADGSNSNLPPIGAKNVGTQPFFGDGTGKFTPGFISYTPYGTLDPAGCSPPFDHYPARLYGTGVSSAFTPGDLPMLAVRDDLAYQVQPVLPAVGSTGGGWALGAGGSAACAADAHNLIATADFNADGYADLLFQKRGSLFVFLNTKQKTFQQSGDLSVDGSLTTPGQLTAPLLAPNFTGVSPTLGQPYFPGAIATADLDHDGNLDLLVTYANLAADRTSPTSATPNYLYLWFGSGAGKFLTTTKHPVNPIRITLSRNYYQVATTDLNKDGIPDLLLSDGLLLSYQLGLGDGTFGPEQHLLAGQGLNTILAADLRHSGNTDLLLANGGATLSNPVANLETLTPNPDVNTGGITVLLNAGPQVTTPIGSLVATPEPSAFESAITFTATLSGNGSIAPTGTVSFLLNGTSAGTATLANGSATLLLAAPYPAYLNGKPLLPGTYTLTATYSGDVNYAAATLTGSHTVLPGPTTVVITPTTPLQTYFGQPIDGTFAVSVLDSAYPATGSYTLLDNGVAVPICTNLPLTRTCPYGNPVLLNAGPHSFSIAYNGGAANADPINASSVSNTIAYTVQPDITLAGTLASSLNPSIVGQSVTFSAIFTSNVSIPTGQVRFLDGATVIGTGTLNSAGQAFLTTSSLAAGTRSISAAYDATINFLAAASASLGQVVLPVTPAPFSLTVTPNSLTLGVGRTATLLATVTGPIPIALSCADTFGESTCIFSQTAFPAGGGATSFLLSTSAPHDCGDPGHPYFLGQITNSPGKPGALLAALATCTLLIRRRRRLPSALLLLTVAALALGSLSGCGHCTDLGTRPGTYSFTVTATASDGSTRQVIVPVRVTLPGE